MDKLIINGPAKLSGEVEVSSSKNASLPIIVATLLSSTPVHLRRLPKLRDVDTMFKLLRNLGATVTNEGENEENTIINTQNLTSFAATYDLVKTMRASFLVLGPLLARYGQAKVSLPGGCAIGARAIDIHLEGLKLMGAEITLAGGYVEAKVGNGNERTHTKLVGTEIPLSFPSVGATENIIMAATLASGTTVIKNAACEPEIEDLCNFLKQMGAKIEGGGTSQVTIEGISELQFPNSNDNQTYAYEVIPDRIEAVTYIIAGIITNSKIAVRNVIINHIDAVIATLKNMGANLHLDPKHRVVRVLPTTKIIGTHVDTAPYPGVPTDIQAQLMALSTIASTPTVITEHIFENRFMHVPELNRLGANILLRGNSAFIQGGCKLIGAPVMCTDLRASAALVLAALAAEGNSDICRIYHLDRGYENLDKKLKNLNVDIKRVKNGM